MSGIGKNIQESVRLHNFQRMLALMDGDGVVQLFRREHTRTVKSSDRTKARNDGPLWRRRFASAGSNHSLRGTHVTGNGAG